MHGSTKLPLMISVDVEVSNLSEYNGRGWQKVGRKGRERENNITGVI